MLPQRVHLDDVGARFQQRAIDVLLVGQGEAGRGKRQQRRGAARDQAEDEIVRTQSLHLRQDATRGGAAFLVGHGMGRLDDLDLPARLAIAVARHDQALERMRPLVLDRARHGRARLAGADHHGLALRRLQLRDIGREAGRGTGGGECCIEQVAQQNAGIGIFHLHHLHTIGARCNSCSGRAIRRHFPSTTPRARRRCCCSATMPARRSRRRWATSASPTRNCRAISAGTSAASMPQSSSPASSTRRCSPRAIRGW